MPWLRSVALAALLVGGLQACQSFRDIKDVMEGRTPEGEGVEVGAAKGPPLSIPPDYQLRPPVGGGSSSDNKTASQVARTRVFNLPSSGAQPGAPQQGPSPGERVFLRKLESTIGGSPDPQVRQKIADETQLTGDQEKLLTDKLLTWRQAAPADAGQSGKGVSEKPVGDDSPVVIRKRRGLLESIF